jgi:hypothetical protein
LLASLSHLHLLNTPHIFAFPFSLPPMFASPSPQPPHISASPSPLPHHRFPIFDSHTPSPPAQSRPAYQSSRRTRHDFWFIQSGSAHVWPTLSAQPPGKPRLTCTSSRHVISSGSKRVS